jgi:thermitase
LAAARLIVCALVLCLGTAFSPSSSLAATSGSPPVRLLVGFQPGTAAATLAAIDRRLGAAAVGEIPEISVRIVEVPAAQALNALAGYRSEAAVRYAEADARGAAVETPNDPYYSSQWGLAKVRAPAAWDVTHGSSTVRLAVLDTGVHGSHTDLSGKVVSTANFSSSWTSDDIRGHGTHVAGIAAATTNNGTGVAGLGWATSIMNVKVLGDDGVGWYSWMAQGMIWAADHGARVINMSFGGTTASTTLRDAVDYAWGKGVFLAAAAGNNGSSAAFYPAYYANAMAVAATDSSDHRASFSDYGSWVDIAAPGVSIYSTILGGYQAWSGTSMASPFVAGLAALLFTRARDTNGNGRLNDEVRSRILATADLVGLPISGGRINAYRAVQGGTIAGTITDSVTGLPVPGATVSAGSASTTSTASGAYSLPNLWAGTYTVSASAAAYLTTQKSVSLSTGTTTANFALVPYVGTISGTVTDWSTGLPIAGAAVTTGTSTASTDSAGAYTLAGLAPGSHALLASAAGYVDLGKTVTVSSGQTTTADFALVDQAITGTIGGTVTDGLTGLPLPGMTVGNGVASAMTGADGTYTLPWVIEGSYTLTASGYPYLNATQAADVVAGQTTIADFVVNKPLMWADGVTFSTAGAKLRVNVHAIDELARPATGVAVSILWTWEGSTTRAFSGTTDSTGNISFSWLKPAHGTYVATVISLSSPSYTWDSTQGTVSAAFAL